MAAFSLRRRKEDGQPRRRAAYVLPSLFTSGNIFLGFIAIMNAFQGALAAHAGNLGANGFFSTAAKAVGVAFVLDGLDGRIARMTNTVSDFGRELDSLADVITFGIAPAVLAFAWGVDMALPGGFLQDHRAGYFVCFLFLVCGAARLARFNITTNPVPRNPGRPDRKYFVGLPIPAAAALVCAVVYAADGAPVRWWLLSFFWLVLLALVAFLMVSTWRYPSFKEINLLRPRSPLTVVLICCVFYLTWNFGQPFLLALATSYVASGIVIRIAGIIRRRFRRNPPQHPLATQHPSEQQVG
ncbi:MAG TPA: CDP-diacylglycerol--serine O-phosphatidyltransferase [Bryobacteraceae bacterium]|nr:CDP-diacylglycerol--serine O-phosphatidyltransferase [Bryobacteraceae bacterium]